MLARSARTVSEFLDTTIEFPFADSEKKTVREEVVDCSDQITVWLSEGVDATVVDLLEKYGGFEQRNKPACLRS